MSPAPGSFAWLLAHDVRLNWRRFAGMLGAAGKLRAWLIAAAGGVAAHLLAWPIAVWLGPLWQNLQTSGATSAPMAALLLSLFTWMIAQSLFGAMRVLYDRGDLDLTLGSPLSVHRIFAAKALAVAGSTFGSIAVLALPLANMGALTGNIAWLSAYPTLAALALIATALALVLAIGLFFLFGARRARLLTQLSAAFIGGAFVLALQIIAILPDATQASIMTWFAAHTMGETSLALLPVRAALGEPAAIVWLVLMGCVALAGAVWLMSERFAQASLAAAGTTDTDRCITSGHIASGQIASEAGRGAGFRTGLGPALRRKEWRLLLRDPGLFAQLGLQIVYTIPLVVVLLRSGSLPTGVAVAPALVVIAAQVAASLAWITVSGEDAPELIASAPVTPSAVDRAKLWAVAGPVLALTALPLAALLLAAPLAALVAFVLSPAPAPRRRCSISGIRCPAAGAACCAAIHNRSSWR